MLTRFGISIEKPISSRGVFIVTKAVITDFEGGIKRDVATGIELEIVEDSPTAYEQ